MLNNQVDVVCCSLLVSMLELDYSGQMNEYEVLGYLNREHVREDSYQAIKYDRRLDLKLFRFLGCLHESDSK